MPRKDLSKMLTERERTNSTLRFKQTRAQAEKMRDDEVGGKEGIKRHHVRASGVQLKMFGEHLAPLAGWVRTCLNRPWSKCFAELMSTFDSRKVTNQHILQHLYDYIEVDVFEKDGALWCNRKGFHSGVPLLLKESYADFYVHPRTGIVLRNKGKLTYKQQLRRDRAEERAKLAERQIKLPDGTYLVKHEREDERGNVKSDEWYHCVMAVAPERKPAIYDPPAVYQGEATTQHTLYRPPYGKPKMWDCLSEHEKKHVGVPRPQAFPRDALTGEMAVSEKRGGKVVEKLFVISYKTANKKQLELAGVRK